MAFRQFPIQTVNEPTFASNLATGLAGSINQTLQNKLASLAQRQEAKKATSALESLGVPSNIAQNIASAPQQIQDAFMKQFFTSEAFGAQPTEEMQMAQQPVEEAPMPEAVTETMTEEFPTAAPKAEPTQAAPKTIAQAIKANPLQQMPTAKKSFAQLLSTPRPSAADKAKASEFAIKMSKEEQKKIDADTKKDFEDVTSKYRATQENRNRLNKMEALTKKGELPSPLKANLIKALSTVTFTDLTSLLGADAEEFQKLSNDFLRNAKEIFGPRVTQKEIEMYLKTIPSLLQSKEGKLRVIKDLKLFDKANQIRYKAMQDMIKMNGGKRPENMGALLEEKIAPQLDIITKEFSALEDKKPKAKAKKSKWYQPYSMDELKSGALSGENILRKTGLFQ